MTLYLWEGEDADGGAIWRTVRLDGVAAFRTAGVRRGGGVPVAGDDRAEAYLFSDAMRRAGLKWVSPTAYAQMDGQARSGALTLREDGRDRVLFGDGPDGAPPRGPGLMRVLQVAVRDSGSRRMRHVFLRCG